MASSIIQGDALDVLRGMPGESVQMCCTSPPYWGLRDYGHAGQIGLEKTPEEYVARMVEVFREVRRVLKPDGVLWLNLGDSYARTGGATDNKNTARELAHMEGKQRRAMNAPPLGLKPKDLVGIPWRVAFALQADGWFLRSDIIWSKSNPMPESVTDRPTRAHEYIFLMSKSERYFYNSAAIKEPGISANRERRVTGRGGKETGKGHSPQRSNSGGFPNAADKQRGHGRRHAGFNDRWDAMERAEQTGGMRNKRSVWNIATRPFGEAHFAVFPEEIPTVCILAGSKPGDTVLDPFSGAGTVGVVCEKLQRQFIGIELNADYVAMAERRIARVAPLFAVNE